MLRSRVRRVVYDPIMSEGNKSDPLCNNPSFRRRLLIVYPAHRWMGKKWDTSFAESDTRQTTTATTTATASVTATATTTAVKEDIMFKPGL